jgi:hypothetical protein
MGHAFLQLVSGIPRPNHHSVHSSALGAAPEGGEVPGVTLSFYSMDGLLDYGADGPRIMVIGYERRA